MAKKLSKVTFPDGTILEISPDMSPEQIAIIIQNLKGNSSYNESGTTGEETSSKVIIEPMSPDDVWKYGSKKDRLAMFIRNNFSKNYWFTVKEVRDQQLQFVKRLVFGESPAIHTYLGRLYDEGYLHKRKRKYVEYSLTDKIMEEYPELLLNEMKEIMQTALNE